jgi:threonine/homoserine/homoserine lactone efflux protein
MNVAPKLARVALLVGFAVMTFLGVRALTGPSREGDVVASCASNAQKGWIFGGSVTINGGGSTLNCPQKPN